MVICCGLSVITVLRVAKKKQTKKQITALIIFIIISIIITIIIWCAKIVNVLAQTPFIYFPHEYGITTPPPLAPPPISYEVCILKKMNTKCGAATVRT